MIKSLSNRIKESILNRGEMKKQINDTSTALAEIIYDALSSSLYVHGFRSIQKSELITKLEQTVSLESDVLTVDVSTYTQYFDFSDLMKLKHQLKLSGICFLLKKSNIIFITLGRGNNDFEGLRIEVDSSVPQSLNKKIEFNSATTSAKSTMRNAQISTKNSVHVTNQVDLIECSIKCHCLRFIDPFLSGSRKHKTIKLEKNTIDAEQINLDEFTRDELDQLVDFGLMGSYGFKYAFTFIPERVLQSFDPLCMRSLNKNTILGVKQIHYSIPEGFIKQGMKSSMYFDMQ